ncbi:L-rhamnose/proton symporter RhaT [Chitinophaga sp. Cy-1792]|uniref:L-rhamnose/proton symporter RhaT n=1 Tax=Chitinophaga sp. Cy-1792 TaxID=2608339 RepID=UPI001421CD04|nr:L-rhamnose/proton symporter RhaT [Chitinophaga sp. Cy-1792]NIG55327.1 rhamnose:proton symporter [Chitinophaga sp. Cy-1792]
MEVVNGIFFHAMGASGAALCYTPQKKVSGWSWHTYWLLQAAVCWLLLPVLVAWITIPQLMQVLQEAPAGAMQRSFLLGMAYGVGGTAFGIAIRYVGFSLTYAISVGISCVLGTLLPPLVHGTLPEIFAAGGAPYLMSGVAMGAVGIALCGLAGRSKEKDLSAGGPSGFSLAKGLPLCLLSGVLSALYGFSLDQGQPIADIAARHGAGSFQGNVIYLFSNTGAFLTTLVYCLYLHTKEKTFDEYAVAGNSRLTLNYAMAALTGILWYGQFFFYGLGHVRMGHFKFSSWAIHMIMLVLLSAVTGLFLKEYANVSSKTMRTLWLALGVLVAAILLLTYGNYVDA